MFFLDCWDLLNFTHRQDTKIEWWQLDGWEPPFVSLVMDSTSKWQLFMGEWRKIKNTKTKKSVSKNMISFMLYTKYNLCTKMYTLKVHYDRPVFHIQ